MLRAMFRRTAGLLSLVLAGTVVVGTPWALERTADAGVRIRIRVHSEGEAEDVTRDVVKMWRGQLASCYEELDEDALRFQHKMTVTGRVDAGGALVDRQLEGKLADEYVQECMDHAFDSMRFDGIGEQQVRFQLRFNMH